MLKPEMRHVLKDADGRDYFLLIGRIGERWSYRIVEQPSKVWQIEFWNGHEWTEMVVLSAPAYSMEDAVVAAHKILGGEDPRTANADPADAPHHEMPT